jgi:hypothetical protein
MKGAKKLTMAHIPHNSKFELSYEMLRRLEHEANQLNQSKVEAETA